MATKSSLDQEHKWVIPPELRLQLLAALAAKPGASTKMAFDDFLAWVDEDTRAEWVDGEVEMPSPASARHQRIVRFLLRTLASYLEMQPLGSIFAAPFLMKLANAAREPDLLFVAADHLNRVKPTYLDGPADLVIEVVSPESAGRDRGDKFYEYQTAGIPEYWLIDPQAEHTEFYQLESKGAYQVVQLGADEIYHSRLLPGLWLREEWLWQDPLPRPDDVLLEVAGDAYARYLLQRLRQHGFASDEAP